MNITEVLHFIGFIWIGHVLYLSDTFIISYDTLKKLPELALPWLQQLKYIKYFQFWWRSIMKLWRKVFIFFWDYIVLKDRMKDLLDDVKRFRSYHLKSIIIEMLNIFHRCGFFKKIKFNFYTTVNDRITTRFGWMLV